MLYDIGIQYGVHSTLAILLHLPKNKLRYEHALPFLKKICLNFLPKKLKPGLLLKHFAIFTQVYESKYQLLPTAYIIALITLLYSILETVNSCFYGGLRKTKLSGEYGIIF